MEFVDGAWQKPDKKRQRLERQERLKQLDPARVTAKQLQIGSEVFDAYYRQQFKDILSEDEFSLFRGALTENLPVTFRLNPSMVGFERLVEILKDPKFIESHAALVGGLDEYDKHQMSQHRSEGPQAHASILKLDPAQVKVSCKPYYPQELVFELPNVCRDLLKKNEGLQPLNELLKACNEAGLITRQEIVSMLPPLLCGIESHHAVFDMCAAPGSKTAQALELIMSDHLYGKKSANTVPPRGFVVANDADQRRAYLLTHQMNRLNTANVAVLNHNAQEYPELFAGGERCLFDRVLCDVPCSSDAAIRKMPQRWASWSPKESHSLHELQTEILCRGLEVLKVGGRLSYSTCSLSPIENEAVVAAALKRYEGRIRLVQTALSGFQFQQGLTSWSILAPKPKAQEEVSGAAEGPRELFETYGSIEEVPSESKGLTIAESMFSGSYEQSVRQELSKCLRVMPHHQNTSGFFITIIEKVQEFGGQSQGAEAKDLEKTRVIQELSGAKKFAFLRADPQDPDIQYIKAYYGLSDDFPLDQLICQNEEMKKISFISKSLSDYLYANVDQSLNIIDIGVPLFQRTNAKHTAPECLYRVAQDGIVNLAPFMTKRIVRTSSLATLKQLIMHRYSGIEALEDESLRKEIGKLSPGCFVIAVELACGNTEFLTMHICKTDLLTLGLPKEILFGMHMRYLDGAERKLCAEVLERAAKRQ